MTLQEQRVLSSKQIEAFYHDHFVRDQLRDFLALLDAPVRSDEVVVDVGGGCGFFARGLRDLHGLSVRVLDADPQSIAACQAAGIDAIHGDALQPQIAGDEGIVCFNLILHHLIGNSEADTRRMQCRALAAWKAQARAIFVNEYIYESHVSNLSGWLIFQVTKSRVLSWIGRVAATIVPDLRANTFGIGVRFRAHEEWRKLFASAGYAVSAVQKGQDEDISLPRRMLLIKRIRRDSFLLTPR